ncbi:MAG TPA: BLUF domain-containing protein [Limnobacter sp.]|nr:BLUF domain-containing protein [Limnobacter sp.]
MLSLVYTSVQTVDMDVHSFARLCATASARNDQLGISGVLLCNGREFLQCLEGPTVHVSSVYSSILQDARHSDIRLLYHQAVTQRMFEGWSMAGLLARRDERNADLPYALLDHRLNRPWQALGVGAVDLVFEYARVKRNLEMAGQPDLLYKLHEQSSPPA